MSIEAAAAILRASKYVVAFTGAGVSTESGIPDFRSKGGLWDRYDPDVCANIHVFLRHPEHYWKMEADLSAQLRSVQPNPAHNALVDLERKGKLKAIITQNVDRLHQRAGSTVPIFELHGSAEKARCLTCEAEYSGDEILQRVWDGDPAPTCDACGGLVKPCVVLFGEGLPPDAVHGAFENAKKCDCLLIIGTSLRVTPANQVPGMAKDRGAAVIFVNLEPTFMDDMADVVLHGKAGEILPKLVKQV